MGLSVGGYIVGMISVYILRWVYKQGYISDSENWKDPEYLESPCFFK